MSSVILSVRELSVSFDGFVAVDGLNFAVERNELRCVIRPDRRGEDHIAGYDLRQDEAVAGYDQV